MTKPTNPNLGVTFFLPIKSGIWRVKLNSLSVKSSSFEIVPCFKEFIAFVFQWYLLLDIAFFGPCRSWSFLCFSHCYWVLARVYVSEIFGFLKKKKLVILRECWRKWSWVISVYGSRWWDLCKTYFRFHFESI